MLEFLRDFRGYLWGVRSLSREEWYDYIYILIRGEGGENNVGKWDGKILEVVLVFKGREDKIVCLMANKVNLWWFSVYGGGKWGVRWGVYIFKWVSISIGYLRK